MSIPLPPGCLADTLCRAGECEGCESLFANRDATLARLALTPALLHPGAMASLRRFAVVLAGGAALDRLDDHAVLAVLGEAVATGRLHLCRSQAGAEASAEGSPESPVDFGVASKQTEITGAPAPAPPAPRMAAAPRPPPPPPPAPPADAAPEIDAAAQAATLREAARSGVPFCEECERARAARAAHEAVPA